MGDNIPNSVIPNPDPSAITSLAIVRAVESAKEVLNARIDGIEKGIATFQGDLVRVPTAVDRAVSGLRELLEARIHGLDLQMEFVQMEVGRSPADIGEQIKQLHNLLASKLERLEAMYGERFIRIDTQFTERDKRAEQLSLADKTAVAAALQAAKEAVGAQNTSNGIAISKSESSTVESIRQLQSLFNSGISAVNDKLNDTRSRLDRGDGNLTGHGQARVEYRDKNTDTRGLVFGVIGALVGFAAMLVAFLTHVLK